MTRLAREIEHRVRAEERRTARRERFQREFAETLATWRLGCIPHRTNGAAEYIFREGMADIIRLRLRIAYSPLLQVLERIEKQVGVLADLRREPWAQAGHEVNAPRARS